MPRLKHKELTKMERKDLLSRLSDLRVEYSKLRSSAARGVIGKESGKLRTTRRNMARVLTVLNQHSAKTESTKRGEK